MKRIIRIVVPFWAACGIFLAFYLIDALSFWRICNISLGGWAWIFLTGINFALAITAVYLLVPCLARFLLIPVFLYCLVVSTAVVFLRVNFDMKLGGDWLVLLMTSSMREVAEFLSSYSLLSIVGGGLAFVLIAGCGVWLFNWLPRERKGGWRFALGLACLLPFMLDAVKNGWQDVLFRTTYVSLIRDTWRSQKMGRDLISACEHPVLDGCPTLRRRGNQLPVFVLIIGESATRNHWSLYGYERDTTPCCSAYRGKMVVFTDVITAFPRTVGSLRYILTRASLENGGESALCSLPSVLKCAGYSTVLLSAQARWDHNMCQENGMQEIVFSACDQRFYLDEHTDVRPYYDDQLVPMLREQLSNAQDRPLAILVNLMGSHFDFAKRFPAEFAKYSSGTLPSRVDYYDDSIRFTDFVLGRMMDVLSCDERPVVLVYLSDHGETPNADGWRQMRDPDCWEIPFFIWWNQSYEAVYLRTVERIRLSAHRKLQTDQLFEGLVDLAQIDIPSWRAEYNFISPTFKERPVRMLLLDAVNARERIPYASDANHVTH